MTNTACHMLTDPMDLQSELSHSKMEILHYICRKQTSRQQNGGQTQDCQLVHLSRQQLLFNTSTIQFDIGMFWTHCCCLKLKNGPQSLHPYNFALCSLLWPWNPEHVQYLQFQMNVGEGNLSTHLTLQENQQRQPFEPSQTSIGRQVLGPKSA